MQTVATFAVVATFFILSPVVQAEEITDYSTDIQIQEDASLDITETIQYDFEDARRHGIFRTIPVRYGTEAGSRRIFIDDIIVRQDDGEAEWETSKQGDNLEIKIGDPDEKITREHTYEIDYTVHGALNFFDDERAELYWDVVGDEWETDILQAEGRIQLPVEVSESEVQIRCFMGRVGSDSECWVAKFSSGSLLVSTGQNASFSPGSESPTVSEMLQPGEGMTVVLNFPAEIVQEPTALASVWWWLAGNPIVLLPLLTLLISFYVWWRWGKDPEGRGVIVTQYEPPENMKPILVGALVDDTVHTRDITAGILWLAQQGYITITQKERKSFFSSSDYELKKERSFGDISDRTYQDLAYELFSHAHRGGDGFTDSIKINSRTAWYGLGYASILFLGLGAFFFFDIGGGVSYVLAIPFILMFLFLQSWYQKQSKEEEQTAEDKLNPDNGSEHPVVLLSHLKTSQEFGQAVKKMKKRVMQDMRNRGWFAAKNKLVGWLFGTITTVGFALVQFGGGYFGGIGVASIIATVLIAGGFSAIMKKKTKAGAILQEKLLGFQEFLAMTQKERLDFHNAPERSPQEFMEYLPYAVALEVEEKWVEQFAGLDLPPPRWYRTTGTFVAADFASDLSSFSDSYSQAAGGSSGTSGGSAGGGMGGGGGGSW